MVGMALLGELLSSITLKIFFNLYSSKSLWDILGVVLPFSGRPLSAKKFVLFPAMIYVLVLPRPMKKTPPTAPAEPKVNPVPEKPVSVQELKPPEERVGTLGCSIAPGPSQHWSVAPTGGTGAPGSALGLGETSTRVMESWGGVEQSASPPSFKNPPLGKSGAGTAG